MGYLFFLALCIDLAEGGIDGVGEDFIREYNNVVIVFLCLPIAQSS